MKSKIKSDKKPHQIPSAKNFNQNLLVDLVVSPSADFMAKNIKKNNPHKNIRANGRTKIAIE